MPNLHPMIVHFPIALLTVSFLSDLAGFLLKRDDLRQTGWWLLLAGYIGLAGAVVTGLLGEQAVTIFPEVRERFELHEQLGFLSSALFSLLFFWRISSKTHLPRGKRWLYLLVTTLGLGAIWLGAWHGGELVYGAGVGVKIIAQ